jgi:hypothetical protein
MFFGGDYNSRSEGPHAISPRALDAAMDAQRVYRAHLVNLADAITLTPLSADLSKACNRLYE